MLIIALFLAFISCNDNTSKKSLASEGAPNTNTKQDSVHYEYPAAYSAKATIVEPKYTQIVLIATKAWDNAALMSKKDMFSDTLDWTFAGGPQVIGPRDSVLQVVEKIREKFSRIETQFNAYLPIKTAEQNDTWVCVWKWEKRTDTKGKIDSSFFHEAWHIDKKEKVRIVNQFVMKW